MALARALRISATIGVTVAQTDFLAPRQQTQARALEANAEYYHFFDKNAFSPHGAGDIDDNDSAPSGLTPQQCEDRCTADEWCMCVTQERRTGKCWKRRNCNPSMWTSDYNTGYNVYMKVGQVATGWLQLRLYKNQDKCLSLTDSTVQLGDCTIFGVPVPSVRPDPWRSAWWTTGNNDGDIKSQVFQATDPEKCLQVDFDPQTSRCGSFACPRTRVNIGKCTANDFNQMFWLDSAFNPAGSENIPRPVGRLRWKDQPNYCAVAEGGGNSTGTSIVLADCVDADSSQYWVGDYVER